VLWAFLLATTSKKHIQDEQRNRKDSGWVQQLTGQVQEAWEFVRHAGGLPILNSRVRSHLSAARPTVTSSPTYFQTPPILMTLSTHACLSACPEGLSSNTKNIWLPAGSRDAACKFLILADPLCTRSFRASNALAYGGVGKNDCSNEIREANPVGHRLRLVR
jgi:hypothetical protein